MLCLSYFAGSGMMIRLRRSWREVLIGGQVAVWVSRAKALFSQQHCVAGCI